MTPALVLAAAIGWTGLTPEAHVGGRKLSEGYMQGKVALVCRWGAKSEEDRGAMLRLQQVWDSYKSKPLVMLGSHAADRGSVAVAKSFVKDSGITFPVYAEAGIANGVPTFSKTPSFYVVDATGRMLYRGLDERRAEEAVVIALTNYASPPNAAYWTRLLQYEVDVLPGRALMHLEEFRKRFPAEAKAFDDQYKALKARSEARKLAKLEAFAAKARDFDPSAGKGRLQKLLSQVKAAGDAYESLKEHADPAIVQEAKNCLADLKWAEVALKACLGK